MRMGRATFGAVEVAVEAVVGAAVETVVEADAVAGAEATVVVVVLMDEVPLEELLAAGLSDVDLHPASNNAESEVIAIQLDS